MSNDVKIVFNSSNAILIKADKMSAPSKKLSKKIQLRSLTLAYENFFLYDLKNIITETCVTELNKNFLTYVLISFSDETKTDSKLALISPSSKPKFNLKKVLIKIK